MPTPSEVAQGVLTEERPRCARPWCATARRHRRSTARRLLTRQIGSCSVLNKTVETKLPLGLRVVFNELLDLVERKRELLPGARVAAKENARGDFVLAIIVPSNVSLPPELPATRGRR
jgi:hypothetical protein